MSAPFAVVVNHSDSPSVKFLEAYGPFDEDEALALERELRERYGLDATALVLKGWTKGVGK